jgi:hypothetical protein
MRVMVTTVRVDMVMVRMGPAMMARKATVMLVATVMAMVWVMMMVTVTVMIMVRVAVMMRMVMGLETSSTGCWGKGWWLAGQVSHAVTEKGLVRADMYQE